MKLMVSVNTAVSAEVMKGLGEGDWFWALTPAQAVVRMPATTRTER
jgi:hypothetical protein